MRHFFPIPINEQSQPIRTKKYLPRCFSVGEFNPPHSPFLFIFTEGTPNKEPRFLELFGEGVREKRATPMCLFKKSDGEGLKKATGWLPANW